MRMSLTQSMTLGLRRRRCVVVDAKLTLGAGDAFLAGFVRGWLASESLEQCKRLGNAMGALVASRRGCAPAMPTRVELDACLARAHTSHRIDRDPEVEFLHRATTRSTRWSELHVLALDHRWQLEELVDSVGASRARISRLKTLVAEGAIRGANASGARQLGMIVDDTFGGDVLAALRDRGIWLARPIEASGRVPLAFDDELNVELALRGRPPSEIVKCLVQSAEDMSATDRAVQNRRLRRLYGACVDLERSLVVEAMPTAAGRIDARRISTMVEEIYALGIRPDWWKLPAPDDAAGFDAVSRIVEAHDPHCCGILILGYDASLDALRAAFRASAGWRHFNGFAVGRAIFWDAAVAWFAGNLGDDGVIGGLDSLRFARRRLAVAGRGRAMTRLRLTMAEALVRHLAAQHVEIDGHTVPLFGGVFAIFGHGNVSGLGRALADTDRSRRIAHNEQAMAHAAIAFAKASKRRRIMACTTSIGPGATNLVTAAATAHVNRIPVLLLPADTFASRAPDPSCSSSRISTIHRAR